jgi:hypothetical protein
MGREASLWDAIPQLAVITGGQVVTAGNTSRVQLGSRVTAGHRSRHVRGRGCFRAITSTTQAARIHLPHLLFSWKRCASEDESIRQRLQPVRRSMSALVPESGARRPARRERRAHAPVRETMRASRSVRSVESNTAAFAVITTAASPAANAEVFYSRDRRHSHLFGVPR